MPRHVAVRLQAAMHVRMSAHGRTPGVGVRVFPHLGQVDGVAQLAYAFGGDAVVRDDLGPVPMGQRPVIAREGVRPAVGRIHERGRPEHGLACVEHFLQAVFAGDERIDCPFPIVEVVEDVADVVEDLFDGMPPHEDEVAAVDDERVIGVCAEEASGAAHVHDVVVELLR